jgi:hypothetical protein
MSVERRFEMEEGNQPREGASVTTSDGENVGRVSEISGSFFKVNAPLRRDFWLSLEYATLTLPEEVQLEFGKKELDDHKLAEPGLEPEEDPMRDIARDSVILSEDEQLEQRARMERELAMQRKDLPIHQPGGDDSGTIGEPLESELARLEEELGVAGNPASTPTLVDRRGPAAPKADRARDAGRRS